MTSALELAGVSVSFANGTRALADIDLVVQQGEFCVLLGPSGSGKSTLLKTVNGLIAPSEGRVAIAGQQRWPSVRDKRRFDVATIHQGVDLVDRLTVLDNVLCGSLASMSTLAALFGVFGVRRKREACALLHRVGLSEEHLYRRATELSGGQQQRVGIARAFMSSRALILADEPVASLDPRTSREILSLLQASARENQTSVLCSLHDVELARQFADRIVAMRAGRIAFDRRPRDLDVATLDGLYAAAA